MHAAKKEAEPAADFSMNINGAVDKAYEGKSMLELSEAPISALQGLADSADAIGKDLKIETVGKLGNWKYFLRARAVCQLAKYETAGKREDGSIMNINKGIDKDFEAQSFTELLKLPTSALQGLSDNHADLLKKLKIKTIKQLGSWKLAEVANAIYYCAKLESADLKKSA